MSIREKLVSNATYLSFNWVATTILPVIFWFIVGKTLPPESYGIIATSLQIAIFMSFVSSVGFPMALDKLIPEFLERNDKDRVQGVINHTFSITMALIAVISAGMFLLTPYFSSFFNLSKEVMWAIILLFIVNTSGNYFKNVYYGFQDMKRIFLTNLFGQSARVIVTFLLIYMGFSHFGALGGLFSSFLIIFLTRFDKKLFRISENPVVDTELIYKYSVPSLIYLILIQLYGNTQNILLSSLTTVELSGLFGIAMTMASLISTLPQIVSAAIFPVLSGLCADEKAKQKQLYLLKLVYRYSLLIALPVGIAVLMFPEYVILLVSKPEYLPAAAFLIFLIPAEILNSISGLFLSSLYAIGNPKKRTIAWAIVVAIYIPLTIFMIDRLAAEGLAISYFSISVLLFLISLYYIKNDLSFQLPKGETLKVLLSMAIPLMLMFYSKSFLSAPSPDNLFAFTLEYIKLGAIIGGSFLVYGLIVLKWNLLIQEDIDIIETIENTAPIFKKELNFLRTNLSKYVKRSYRG